MRFLCALLLLVGLLTPSHATLYYVSPTGNNGNDCIPNSPSTPMQSIAKGFTCLQPGDTLYLRQGTYPERIHPADFHLPSGTSWSTPITIAGYPGETATIAVTGSKIQDNLDNSVVSYLIFDHLTFGAAPVGDIQFEVGGNSAHIRLSNSDLSGAAGIWIVNTTDDVQIISNYIHDMPAVFVPEYGITVGNYGSYTNGTHVLFDGNTFKNVSGYCIHSYWSSHSVNEAIIRNNTFVNCGYDDGERDNGTNVAIMAGSDNKFYNNLLYNNSPVRGSSLISVSGGAGDGFDNLLYNNTFYNNVGSSIEVNTSALNTQAINNIMYLSPPLQNNGAAGLIQHHTLLTDPSFANASGSDFHLTAASTTAVDQGATLAIVATDKENIPRPQGSAYDIGAYEYGGSGGVTPGPQALRWKFDEGSGSTATDATGNGYAGTLVNSPTRGAGRVGAGSVTFDGTTQYVKADSFIWQPGQAVTVVFWVNKTPGPPSGAFGMRFVGSERFGAHVAYSTGDTTLYWDYGSFTGAGRLLVDFTPYLGQWTHVALVSAGSAGAFKAIYLNGVQVASAANSSAPSSAMTGIDLGRWVLETGTLYDSGSYDDFKLENRVWSPAEIAADFAQGSSVARRRAMVLR